MAAGSIHKGIEDYYTRCFNQVHGLYLEGASKTNNLSEYSVFPDPFVDFGEFESPPDFIAIGPSSDVQVIQIVGASRSISSTQPILQDDEEILSDLKAVSQDVDNNPDEITDFLQSVGEGPASILEKVAVLPENAYMSNKSAIDEIARSDDLNIWVLSNPSNELWLEVGNHDSDVIEEVLDGNRVEFLDINCDLVSAARKSDIDLIKYRFAQRLLNYSYNEHRAEVGFHEIDGIMVDNDRPLLGHLPKKERQEYWQQCMLSMKLTFELMEESSKGVEHFEWKKTAFLTRPSLRSRRLETVREQLGLGEAA